MLPQAPSLRKPLRFARASLDDRGQPDEHRRRNRKGNREADHPPVHRQFVHARQDVGPDRPRRLHGDNRQPDTGKAPDQGEHQMLGEYLAEQASAAGADREAHRELAPAIDQPHEQEVGDVGARNDHDQPHRPEQDQERISRRLHQLVAHRTNVGRRHVLVLIRMLVGEARAQDVEVRVGHGDRDPGFQPGDDIEHSGAALLADRRAVRRRRIHRQGRPHLDRTRTEREVESRRGHTDDGERLAVEQDAGTDDRRIVPEVGAPQIVADDRHPRPRALIVGHEKDAQARAAHGVCRRDPTRRSARSGGWPVLVR